MCESSKHVVWVCDEDIKDVSMALLLTLCIERNGLETFSSLCEKSATLG